MGLPHLESSLSFDNKHSSAWSQRTARGWGHAYRLIHTGYARCTTSNSSSPPLPGL